MHRTVLHWATRSKSPAVLDALLPHTFRYAVHKLHANLTGRTLINARDDEQLTALHWAAISNQPEHVRMLLANQADALVGDADGRTALHYAVSRSSVECMQVDAVACLPSLIVGRFWLSCIPG